MKRRTFLATAGALGAAAAFPAPALAQTRELIVAEPARSVGYLPFYVAVSEGYFAEAGLDISILTAEQAGAAINAAVTGQAFAFLGGPERVAFARAQGSDLRSVVNCVDRANVYFAAAKGTSPADGDLAGFMRGKRIAVGPRGTSPHSVMHYVLEASLGLDYANDVTLLESPAAAALAIISAGQADIAVTSDPVLVQGERQDIWDAPFYSAPDAIGPLAYSVLNVSQASITDEPELVADFVVAVMRALEAVHADPELASAVAQQEFPTMEPDELQATIDRSFEDDLWSPDGTISRQSWESMHAVVRQIGALQTDVPYEDIIDMSFVEAAAA